MTAIADVMARLVLDDASAKKQLSNFGNDPAAAKAGSALGTRVSSGIGKAFAVAGGSSGLLLSGAVEAAGSFDQQLRTIQTVATDLSDTQLSAIGDDIQALARETGKSTDDLTSGFYDLVSAGVPAEDAISVLRDSAKLATGALGTTGETVDLVTSALNAYGLGADQSTRVTDIFAKAVADGKVTAAELGNSLANVAPIAASAGVSLEEVSAGYALLTAKGVPAAQAATQMRAAISALLTPNEQLNAIQKTTGINFAKLADEKGLAVALQTLRQEFDTNAKQLKVLSEVTAKEFPKALQDAQEDLNLTASDMERFAAIAGKDGVAEAVSVMTKELGAGDEGFAKALGSTEAYGFALATTGENAEAMAAQIIETGDATGLAQEQYDIASKGAEATASRAAQTVGTFLQDIGKGVLPIAGPALLTINQLGPALGGIISPAKLAGGAIGGIAGKAIPALISGMAGIIPAITPALSAIGTAIPTIISAAMALWPVILVAAIIAGIIFLINNPEIVGEIANFVGGVIQSIMTFLGELPGHLTRFFAGVFAAVARLAPGMVQAIVGFILSIPGKILGLVGQVVGVFNNIKARASAAILAFLGTAVRAFLALPLRIAGLVGQVVAHFGNMARLGLAKVAAFIGSVVSFFLSIPGKIAALGGRIVSGIINGLRSLPGKLADTVRNAFASLRIDIGPFHISSAGVRIDLPNIQLPSFASGIKRVPFDMVAQIHKGEMIVPEDEVASVVDRSGLQAVEETAGAGGAGQGGPWRDFVVHGALPVRTIRDVSLELQRAAMGRSPARAFSPAYRRKEAG